MGAIVTNAYPRTPSLMALTVALSATADGINDGPRPGRTACERGTSLWQAAGIGQPDQVG
jgi:hypothetical protein